MRVIIAGSRGITDYSVVEDAVRQSGYFITTVVSGRAQGVDRLGEEWAKARAIPIARFPAAWDRYGKRAGVLRNQQMAKYSDALIAVWDGESRGTFNMISEARQRGLKVFVHKVDSP